MRTEKVVTVQGKTYIYPHEAKDLLQVLTIHSNATPRQAKIFADLVNNLKEVSDMDGDVNQLWK